MHKTVTRPDPLRFCRESVRQTIYDVLDVIMAYDTDANPMKTVDGNFLREFSGVEKNQAIAFIEAIDLSTKHPTWSVKTPGRTWWKFWVPRFRGARQSYLWNEDRKVFELKPQVPQT